jgi:hypothetical protein
VKKIKEKDIENAIFEYAKKHLKGVVEIMKVETFGVYDPTRKIHRPPGKNVRKGMPDITGVIKGGRALYAEVKTPESIKRVRKHYQNIVEGKSLPKSISDTMVAQVKLMELFKNMGAVGFFCSSVDEFLDLLVKEGGIEKDAIPRLF